MNAEMFDTYLGLIYQGYGLAFFVLGVIAALLNVRQDGTVGAVRHLGWLAAFGMLHGLQEFIIGERLQNPAVWLAVLGSALTVSSYIALMEFGRRLCNERLDRRRLSALPLYLASGLGVMVVMGLAPVASAGVELGVRYLIGVPAAVLAGSGLLAQAGIMPQVPDTLSLRKALRVAGLAMICYAVLTLFISPMSARLMSDWLPTTADFLAATGLPVQVARALCAVVLSTCFVIISKHNIALINTTLSRVTGNLNGFVYRCLNDPAWTVTFMSGGGERLTGYPVVDFLRGKRHFADQIHPDDQQRVWDDVQSAISARRQFRLQYRMINAGGEVRWCYEEGRGQFDAQGELLYLEGMVRDDDDRHRVESEWQRMQSLVDASPSAVGWADPGGTPRYFNAALRRLMAVPPDADVSAYQLSDFYDDGPYQQIESTVLPSVAAQGAWAGEIDMRALDGRKIPTLHSVYCLRDSSGAVTALANMITDLTEIRQVQQALQRERDFASSLLETAPIIVLLLDPHGGIRHVNVYFERLTGYRLEEIVGKKWFDTFLPAADQARIRELFDEAIHDQPVRGNINPIVTRDGEVRQIEWHADTLYTAEGQVDGLLSIGLDVTERSLLTDELRELNQSLEQRVFERTTEVQRELQRNTHILDTALDGFFAADTSGRIVDVNPAFCAMLGYQKSELLGKSIPDIEAAESAEETAAHINKVLAQGYDRFDTHHRRKDGGIVAVEISVRLVSTDDQSVFFVFVRDISWRKATELALSQAREEAEHANAAKNEFLSRMSHELRTPLNAIIGFTQLLELPRGQSMSGQQSDSVREILSASTHLMGMVDDMLDLANIETGELLIQSEPVALTQVIDQSIKQIQPMIRARSVAVALPVCDSLMVLADPRRLQQVLFNLLSNALKFSRDDGRIEILCAPVPGQRIRISVRDTGPGLSEAQQARLFRPFERLESAYTGVDGIGVGLALVKRLIEGMQGTVGVDSVPDQGSSFWFELPQYVAFVPHPTQAQATGTTSHGNKKVLCIEDNPANQRLVQKMLSKITGIELVIASTAEQGLALASQELPGLILLDINLPGMDGFAALERLRADPATCAIPVIAVSANAMKRDIEHGKAAGFQDYLVKPLNMHAFLEVINQHLGLAKEDL